PVSRSAPSALRTTAASDTVAGEMRSAIRDALTGGSDRFRIQSRIQETQHVLAISVGGQNGAFSSGFLTGWSKTKTRPDFDIVTGASAGALVAPVAFAGTEFDEDLARNVGIGESDVFRRRFVLGALFSSSFFDTGPLFDQVRKLYNRAPFLEALTDRSENGGLLLVGATDLQAGRFQRFDFGRLLQEEPEMGPRVACLTEATLASAAIPGLFPPRVINDRLYADAGVRQSIFLDQIVAELDATEGQRGPVKVYLLINSVLSFETREVEPSLLPLVARNLEIFVDEGMRASILRVLNEAKFRGWTLQAAAIPAMPDCREQDGGQSLIFSKCVTEALFDSGVALATSKDPWMSAKRLRNKLEEGRVR
ncbi:MAG: patatin-like phospholipase family protein, partial [Pseudomonadota bacterium]